MSIDQSQQILAEIQAIRQAMAVHEEQHVSQARRCASHSETIDRHDTLLNGNGRPGLKTTVAIHSWAIGLGGLMIGGLVTHVITRLFGG